MEVPGSTLKSECPVYNFISAGNHSSYRNYSFISYIHLCRISQKMVSWGSKVPLRMRPFLLMNPNSDFTYPRTAHSSLIIRKFDFCPRRSVSWKNQPDGPSALVNSYLLMKWWFVRIEDDKSRHVSSGLQLG